MFHHASQPTSADRLKGPPWRRIRLFAVAACTSFAAVAALSPPSMAHADQPTELVQSYDFVDVNACTSEPDVFHVDVDVRVHDGHAANIVVIGDRQTGWTDSGFELVQGRSSFVQNHAIERVALLDVWEHPDTGDRLVARFVVVVDLSAGEVRVDSFVTVRCLGDHKFISTPGPA